MSHIVPFYDGISGQLKCTLEALSPVYIRNGGDWTRDQIKNDPMAQSFFEVDGTFIIPGSSLRGMLRNVLEIASFGKLSRTRTDNRPFALRDLTYKPYIEKLINKVNAAWLEQDKKGDWNLYPCRYARVNHDLLIAHHGGDPDLKSAQSAEEKYIKWGSTCLDVVFDYEEGKWVTSLSGGSHRGKLVFTGQPQDNKGKNGQKKKEFVFFDQVDNGYHVPDEIREKFEFVHTQNSEPVASWKYWKDKLQKGQTIPIFYLGTPENPESMGLAQMYRIPYTYSVLDAVRHTCEDHLSEAPDLADLIFGYVNNSQDSLKGRVSIGHAEADGAPQSGGLVHTILSAPKPTYYPNYVVQPDDTSQRPKTFMDDDCQIRGWKRYPARESITPPSPVGPDQHNVDTMFKPLERGSQFTFTIRFHNLKPCELGALIWALTWGGRSNLCHSLGMGKPFGFGQVKISVNDMKLFNCRREPLAKTTDDLLENYTTLMQQAIPGWEETPQMQQLLAMADSKHQPCDGSQEQKLKYMILGRGDGNNEFVNAKRDKERLEPHK